MTKSAQKRMEKVSTKRIDLKINRKTNPLLKTNAKEYHSFTVRSQAQRLTITHFLR